MELVHGCKKTIVCMTHISEYGNFKVVKECTLPLTGK